MNQTDKQSASTDSPALSQRQACALRNCVWLYLGAISCTVFSVLFLDRPLSTWLHHNVDASAIFKPLSQMPLLFESLSAVIILACINSVWRNKLASMARALLITLLIASIARVGAKFIFGRTWPETWIYTDTSSNLSWIHNGVERFHPFAIGAAYNSFPSGHALFTFALVTVFWWRFPKLYGLWLLAMLGAIAGQLGQNYHFLGDLLAGATLGVLSAQIAIRLSCKSVVKNPFNSDPSGSPSKKIR
ncbi:phosphatase PAP2 family protein [Shewanella schlegeliana]|uniref:Phosphatase PAP2 family protein n=1 Tax=Shewanella schlegeliana TaxID=190308 RepID=A0ABS1T074_9GAMM|nr:phosphatase PAP2 family protein [Shewanella schlegeliana]MBL4913655.1 phosphatase PAP2 family protein [Shewanella schlegeliana]MCL1108546.1 phosphatase PAP2 family protein [Shewanella schlegeliana]GIU30984.1 phosphatidylglycerophosphatase B [Shewanella schlegeliana]